MPRRPWETAREDYSRGGFWFQVDSRVLSLAVSRLSPPAKRCASRYFLRRREQISRKPFLRRKPESKTFDKNRRRQFLNVISVIFSGWVLVAVTVAVHAAGLAALWNFFAVVSRIFLSRSDVERK
jgi:hypothetical protein